MPIKLNLVINRGQYNQVQRPNIKINNGFPRNSTVQTQVQALAQPPTPQEPPGISMRRAINAPRTGCKSCGG